MFSFFGSKKLPKENAFTIKGIKGTLGEPDTYVTLDDDQERARISVYSHSITTHYAFLQMLSDAYPQQRKPFSFEWSPDGCYELRFKKNEQQTPLDYAGILKSLSEMPLTKLTAKAKEYETRIKLLEARGQEIKEAKTETAAAKEADLYIPAVREWAKKRGYFDGMEDSEIREALAELKPGLTEIIIERDRPKSPER